MRQLEMFEKNSEDFLFSELNKTQNSMNRQFRALFALVTEVKRDYISLCEKLEWEKKNE